MNGQFGPYFSDQSKLAKRGIFYVGGHISGQEGKRHMCNQMFVEAYVPEKILHPYPLIFFHGAGQTNVNWLVTPDGRMGWADYFLSLGYVVYLAEQPARGRSAYHPEENGSTIYHSMEAIRKRFASTEGNWPQASLHTQWPGSADPEDETFSQFLSSQVEYLPSNRDSQELVLAAGLKLLEKTGPAILLTHSQAGPFGWLLADAEPELVKGIVALEPSGPPFSMDGWVFQDPAPKLPRLSGIPIAFVVSEASYHAQYDHLTSYVMNQCGVDHDLIRLEEAGIHGNGHMMMIEKNSLEIAGLLAGWMEEHIH